VPRYIVVILPMVQLLSFHNVGNVFRGMRDACLKRVPRPEFPPLELSRDVYRPDFASRRFDESPSAPDHLFNRFRSD